MVILCVGGFLLGVGALIYISENSSGAWCLPSEEQVRLLLSPWRYLPGAVDAAPNLQRETGFMQVFKILQRSSPRVS